MSDKIFLLQAGKLVAMERSGYSLEDHLQDLVARYPDLLPGEQLNGAEPRRWLLVAREIGVPDSQDASDRWSLDHLFLDQDGVPTLIEAKRSSDPRIRREVVGQLIEYAANAQSYWDAEQIREIVMANSAGTTECDYLREALGIEDAEDFWQKVKSNLQAGRLRLIFVADAIPRELRRMIEFLNVQMDPAEVFGIELPQFLGGDLQTIVPRLIGNTERAIARKVGGSRIKRKWDEESFFESVKRNNAELENEVRGILEWAEKRGLRIWWGEGVSTASFVAVLDTDEASYQLIQVNCLGKIFLLIDFFRQRPAFAGRDILANLVGRLISGVGLPISPDARRPGFSIAALRDAIRRVKFYELLDSLIEEIQTFHKEP